MLIVRVELLSAITGKTTELARMHICNDGQGDNPRLSDYDVHTLRGRSGEDLDQSWRNKTYTRQGKVRKHRRLDLHVWHLVGKALTAMGYGEGGK